MKRNFLLLLGILFFIALIPSSCELLEDCKTCKQVTYDGSTVIRETTGILYCGEELEEKESAGPTSVGSYTAYWECE